MSFNFNQAQKREQGGMTINTPAPSAEETELKKINLEVAKLQAEELKLAKTERERQAGLPTNQLQEQVQQKALENIYARMTGAAPVLAPEEEARLNTIYGAAKSQGEQALNQYAEQTAGMRGMRPTDSPIGGDIMRQRANLELGLQGQKAASSLDLGQASTQFNAQMAEFTNNLRQQAFMQQLSLAGTAPASYGLQQQMFGQRLAGAPRNFTGQSNMSGWNTGFDLSQAAGGAAAMMF